MASMYTGIQGAKMLCIGYSREQQVPGARPHIRAPVSVYLDFLGLAFA